AGVPSSSAPAASKRSTRRLYVPALAPPHDETPVGEKVHSRRGESALSAGAGGEEWEAWLDAAAAGAVADAALPAVHLRTERLGAELTERHPGRQREAAGQRPDRQLGPAEDVPGLDERDQGGIDGQARQHR